MTTLFQSDDNSDQMNCERYQRLLLASLDYELDSKVQRLVQEHMIHCPHCRQRKIHVEEIISLYHNAPPHLVSLQSRKRALNVAYQICRRHAQDPQSFRISYPWKTAARLIILLLAILAVPGMFRLFDRVLAEKSTISKDPLSAYSRWSLEKIIRVRGVYETELGNQRVLVEDLHTAKMQFIEEQSILRGCILSQINTDQVIFYSKTGQAIVFPVKSLQDEQERARIDEWIARMDRRWKRRDFFATDLDYIIRRSQQGFPDALQLLETISRDRNSALGTQAKKILADEDTLEILQNLEELNETPSDPQRRKLIMDLRGNGSPYLLQKLRDISGNLDDPFRADAMVALARLKDYGLLNTLVNLSSDEQLPVQLRIAVYESFNLLLEDQQ